MTPERLGHLAVFVGTYGAPLTHSSSRLSVRRAMSDWRGCSPRRVLVDRRSGRRHALPCGDRQRAGLLRPHFADFDVGRPHHPTMVRFASDGRAFVAEKQRRDLGVRLEPTRRQDAGPGHPRSSVSTSGTEAAEHRARSRFHQWQAVPLPVLRRQQDEGATRPRPGSRATTTIARRRQAPPADGCTVMSRLDRYTAERLERRGPGQRRPPAPPLAPAVPSHAGGGSPSTTTATCGSGRRRGELPRPGQRSAGGNPCGDPADQGGMLRAPGYPDEPDR